MHTIHSRRLFLAGLSLAGVAGFAGTAKPVHAEPPPETTTVRLAKIPGICIAPQYVAEDLLRAEGFTDIRYVETEAGVAQAKRIARGDIDLSLDFAAALVVTMDTDEAIKVLAGVHVGCFELFAREGIRGVADLKGKSVGVQALGSSPHLFLTGIAAYVGLDPLKDIDWVATPSIKPKELFVEGKIDAFLGFPPEPQELRARKMGHVIVNSTLDEPWAQYFCCMLAGNADYVRKHPVATKRALRAILKAA